MRIDLAGEVPAAVLLLESANRPRECRGRTVMGNNRVELESPARIVPEVEQSVARLPRSAGQRALVPVPERPGAGAHPVAKLVDRAAGDTRIRRSPAHQSADSAATLADRIRPSAATVIRRKAPTGWDTNDQTTWEPDHYGGFSYQLVNDALDTLDVDGQRTIADRWANNALHNGLVGLGPARSTYKSSYDKAADAFSVSQDVPMIPKLVVHAHISADDVVAYDGGVNLKWAHDEGGLKAANIPRNIGETLIDVVEARKSWDANPDHDQEEAKAQAERDLFAQQAAAKAEATRKTAETKDMINWGWANTKDRVKFGKYLDRAKKDSTGKRMEEFVDVIRNAKARREAAAAD